MERLNLGNFFYDFFHEDASPPKKKKKTKKGNWTTIFGWLTASQGSQIKNQPFHKAMDFLPIEIRAAWPEVQAKSWIPYVLLICHISQPPGNSAWHMYILSTDQAPLTCIHWRSWNKLQITVSNFDQMTTIYHLQNVEAMHPWWDWKQYTGSGWIWDFPNLDNLKWHKNICRNH